MSKPTKNVIFDSNFSSKKWILYLLCSKCTWCLPVDCFCTVYKSGDMRAMAVWWAKTSDIKSVESRFLWCSVIWMEKWVSVSFHGCGSWSWELQEVQRHTAAAKYTNSVPQAQEKKMTTASEQNRTLCFFLGTPIHVEILWPY